MPLVQVDVPAAEVELAVDALWAARPSAVAEELLGDGRIRLTADLTDVDALDRRWSVRVLDVAADAGLDEWRAWARPHRAGRHLVLQPAWLEPADLGPHDRVVRIEPGRAFGSGSHPSTRLVAALLEDRVAGGEQVLDVGCGSGVLSVVACLLGAAGATAVDLLPEAVTVTEANAVANGVQGRVVASMTPVEELAGSFDLVVANIGLAVLRDLASAIAGRVGPTGVLVLSGLLDDQVGAVLAAYPGWTVLEVRSADGWSALVLTRSRRRGDAATG